MAKNAEDREPGITWKPSGVLGTRRARQIGTAGGDMAKGGLMPEELLDMLLNGVTGFIGAYQDHLGEGVKRVFRIIEVSDDGEGWVEFEVCLRGGTREPGPRYRLTLGLQEIGNAQP